MEYMVDDYVDLLRESLDEAESSSEVERPANGEGTAGVE
jgi:hypothetical protein